MKKNNVGKADRTRPEKARKSRTTSSRDAQRGRDGTPTGAVAGTEKISKATLSGPAQLGNGSIVQVVMNIAANDGGEDGESAETARRLEKTLRGLYRPDQYHTPQFAMLIDRLTKISSGARETIDLETARWAIVIALRMLGPAGSLTATLKKIKHRVEKAKERAVKKLTNRGEAIPNFPTLDDKAFRQFVLIVAYGIKPLMAMLKRAADQPTARRRVSIPASKLRDGLSVGKGANDDWIAGSKKA